MKITPVRLLTLLALFNIVLVFGVVSFMTPDIPKDFSLYSVSIQQPPKTPDLIAEKPQRLVIDAASIDIAVIDGNYDNTTKKWTLSDDAAHYALVTPLPNNLAGNTFIYGHNKRQVFESLSKASVGDSARLYAEGKIFHYTLSTVYEVDPSDVSLFAYQGPPQLTIQTCSGSWYEKRQLFVFSFVKVEDEVL